MADGIVSEELTVEILKSELTYDPETGEFRRLNSRNRWKAGETAGSFAKTAGYMVLRINKKIYLSHRVAWLYMYGEWPIRFIDHINRNKLDNRISNLRDVERCENGRNRGKQSNNTSGYPGVQWHRRHERWRACAAKKGTRIHLGYFDRKEDAISARLGWEAKNPIETVRDE